MIHDLPVDDVDPTIICQIDFANAFQMPTCRAVSSARTTASWA
jgi:hypothetical protein